MNCRPSGSSVHGFLQARILEWVAMPLSRWSSQPRDRTCASCIGRQVLYQSHPLGNPAYGLGGGIWIAYNNDIKKKFIELFYVQKSSKSSKVSSERPDYSGKAFPLLSVTLSNFIFFLYCIYHYLTLKVNIIWFCVFFISSSKHELPQGRDRLYCLPWGPITKNNAGLTLKAKYVLVHLGMWQKAVKHK